MDRKFEPSGTTKPQRIHPQIFGHLKSYAKVTPEFNRHVVLTFEQVLYRDIVPVTEEKEINDPPPKFALVFCMQHINDKHFQPLGTIFYNDNPPILSIITCVKQFIDDLKKCGLTVVCSICQPVPILVQVIKELVGKYRHNHNLPDSLVYKSNDVPFIFHLYDPGALLRKTKDKLFKHLLTFQTANGSFCYADIDEIKCACKRSDMMNGDDDFVAEDTTRQATGIFSATITSLLFESGCSGYIYKTQERDVSVVTHFFDELFDSFNGEYFPDTKFMDKTHKYRRHCPSITSGILDFWHSSIAFLERISVVRFKNVDNNINFSEEFLRFFAVYCQDINETKMYPDYNKVCQGKLVEQIKCDFFHLRWVNAFLKRYPLNPKGLTSKQISEYYLQNENMEEDNITENIVGNINNCEEKLERKDKNKATVSPKKLNNQKPNILNNIVSDPSNNLPDESQLVNNINEKQSIKSNKYTKNSLNASLETLTDITKNVQSNFSKKIQNVLTPNTKEIISCSSDDEEDKSLKEEMDRFDKELQEDIENIERLIDAEKSKKMANKNLVGADSNIKIEKINVKANNNTADLDNLVGADSNINIEKNNVKANNNTVDLDKNCINLKNCGKLEKDNNNVKINNKNITNIVEYLEKLRNGNKSPINSTSSKEVIVDDKSDFPKNESFDEAELNNNPKLGVKTSSPKENRLNPPETVERNATTDKFCYGDKGEKNYILNRFLSELLEIEQENTFKIEPEMLHRMCRSVSQLELDSNEDEKELHTEDKVHIYKDENSDTEGEKSSKQKIFRIQKYMTELKDTFQDRNIERTGERLSDEEKDVKKYNVEKLDTQELKQECKDEKGKEVLIKMENTNLDQPNEKIKEVLMKMENNKTNLTKQEGTKQSDEQSDSNRNEDKSIRDKTCNNEAIKEELISIKSSQETQNKPVYGKRTRKRQNNFLRNQLILEESNQNKFANNKQNADKSIQNKFIQNNSSKATQNIQSQKNNSDNKLSQNKPNQTQNQPSQTKLSQNKQPENKESQNKESQNKQSQNKQSQNNQSQNKQSQNKQLQNKQSQDKQSQNIQSLNKQSQNKQSQNKQSQNNQSQHKQSQNKQLQNKQSQDKQSQNKQSQNKQSQNKQSQNKQSEDKPTQIKQSQNNPSLNKSSQSKASQNKSCPNKLLENKPSENNPTQKPAEKNSNSVKTSQNNSNPTKPAQNNSNRAKPTENNPAQVKEPPTIPIKNDPTNESELPSNSDQTTTKKRRRNRKPKRKAPEYDDLENDISIYNVDRVKKLASIAKEIGFNYKNYVKATTVSSSVFSYWIMTIKTMVELMYFLQDKGLSYVRTRSLTVDVLRLCLYYVKTEINGMPEPYTIKGDGFEIISDAIAHFAFGGSHSVVLN